MSKKSNAGNNSEKHQPTKITHDTFFKKNMEHLDIARDFYRSHLPVDILEQIDLSTLAASNVEMHDIGFKGHRSDIIHHIKINGESGYLFTHVEQQTEPEELMPLRMFEYMIAIMRRHVTNSKDNRLPIIVPLIVYNGKKEYKYSTAFFDLFAQNHQALALKLVSEPIQLVDFSKISDEQLKKHMAASLFEYVMKHIWHDSFDELAGKSALSLRDLYKSGIINRETALSVFNDLLYYLLEYSKEMPKEEYEKSIKNIELVLPQELGDIAMNMREVFVEEGMEKGMEKANATAARNFLKNGVSPEIVAKSLSIPKENLQRIIKEIEQKKGS